MNQSQDAKPAPPFSAASARAGVSPRPIWGTLVFVLASTYLVLYAVVHLGRLGVPTGPGAPEYMNALLYVPLSLLAVGACIHASRHATLDGATRRAWRFLAATFALESLQMATQIVGALAGWRPMVDTQAQVVSLSIDAMRYVCTFAAILTFPRAPRRGVDRVTFGLDTITVGAAAGVLAWHFHLRALVEATQATAWQTLFTIAYPVATLSAAFGFTVLLLRRPLPHSVTAIRILAFAFYLNIIADAIYLRTLAAHTSPDISRIFIAYAAIEWMSLAAAYLQSRVAARLRSEPTAPHADATASSTDTATAAELPVVSKLPYLAIVALFGALLVTAIQPPMRDALGLVLGAIVITAVVTMRQIAAQRENRALVSERLEREAHFRALVQHGSEVILVLDAECIVREASPAIARVLGYRPADVVGRAIAELVAHDDAALAGADLAQVVAMPPAPPGGYTATPCEWRMRHADGSTRWLEILCTNLLGDPAVHSIVLNGRDVSERKALEAELTHRAFHDLLTGLVNRARFTDTVTVALARVPATPDRSDRPGLAVIYVDLDRFKPINDRFGHSAGDRVLSAVADRLRDATRGSDTVARLGGDEFGILLERVRNEAEVSMVAERVVGLLSAPVDIAGMEIVVGASVGVAIVDVTVCMPSAEELLQAADCAMYEAKARGGRQYTVAG
jgi:diguanylate cyclase (GGDEF)-like protein/PAS domain S-box-containing protein